jgi:hypothetical protein
MNLQRLEDKIDDTKEAMVVFQSHIKAIAKHQAVLNQQNKEIFEQNKEILQLLNIQRISAQIERTSAQALASGQDSGARLIQVAIPYDGSRCNGR